MRELAAELKVPLVDVHAGYPAFAKKHQTDVIGMLPDGMHPNDLGQEQQLGAYGGYEPAETRSGNSIVSG